MIDMIDIQFLKFNFHLSSQEENSKNHLFSNHFLENVNTSKTFSKNGKYYTCDTINNSLFKISLFHTKIYRELFQNLVEFLR